MSPTRSPGAVRRLVLRIVGAVVVLGVIAGAGWLVGYSQVFAARQVSVSGGDRVTVSEVRNAADVPLGLSLARQDLDGIAGRVRSIPAVATATVERQWPTTITIRITERQAVLGIKRGSGYLLIDDQAVGFATEKTLPDRVVEAAIDPQDARVLGDAAVVAKSLPADLRKKVKRIKATSPSAIKLELDGGVEVNWGSAEESELKAQVVKTLLKEKPSRVIDVSAPHNPATR